MLYILMGKSGSGKDVTKKVLVEKYGVISVLGTTTRPMREGEINKRDYDFILRAEFAELVRQGEFLEYRVYNTLVNNVPDTWYYGTRKQELSPDKDYVIILDAEGMKNVVKYYGALDCFVVEIVAPDTLREERAKRRGSFDQYEWDRRLEDDKEKFKEEKTKGYVNLTAINAGKTPEELAEEILVGKIMASMTESEKDAHVDGVEFVLDWRGSLEQEDYLLYKAIIAERKNQ